MSADLFAEFNNLSSPPPQQQDQTQPQTRQPQVTQPQDPFAFLQPASSSEQSTSNHQTSQQWAAFQPQPGNIQSTPNPQAASQPWPSFQTQSVSKTQSTPNYQSSQPWPSFQPQTSGISQTTPNYQTPQPSTFSQTTPNYQSSQPWPALQSPSTGQVQWGSPAQPSWSSPSRPQESADDDDWGDFEVAESAPKQPPASKPPSLQAAAPVPSQPPPKPVNQQILRTRIVRASTMDLISNNLVDIGSSAVTPAQPAQPAPSSSPPPPPKIQEAPRPQPKKKAMPKPYAQDPDILFDANDFELEGGEYEGDEAGDDEDDDDDEFGDFETVAPAEPQPTPRAAQPPKMQTKPPVVNRPVPTMDMDLLSLDDTPAPVSKPQNSSANHLSFGATATGPSSHNRQGSTSKKPSRPSAIKPNRPVQKAMEKTTTDNDDWGAWDEFVGADSKAETSIPKAAGTKPDQNSDSWDWDAVETTKPAAPKTSTGHLQDDVPPPINVPPPSVLLSAFTELLGAGSSLFKPMSGQNASIKQRIMSDPKAIDFIRGYILLASTAAHIIAGRKQRWHRDKILAKSMSISAAGSKGMKLAGVDKAQSAREDRDAADVVAVWRDNVGRLRSAVAAANSSGTTSLKVPEISETMPIHTIKQALTAPKPCIICGLKREERVAKVDHDVEDSFGEWWVDHWGHRACKNFWIEHEQTLRQR